MLFAKADVVRYARHLLIVPKCDKALVVSCTLYSRQIFVCLTCQHLVWQAFNCNHKLKA